MTGSSYTVAIDDDISLKAKPLLPTEVQFMHRQVLTKIFSIIISFLFLYLFHALCLDHQEEDDHALLQLFKNETFNNIP